MVFGDGSSNDQIIRIMTSFGMKREKNKMTVIDELVKDKVIKYREESGPIEGFMGEMLFDTILHPHTSELFGTIPDQLDYKQKEVRMVNKNEDGRAVLIRSRDTSGEDAIQIKRYLVGSSKVPFVQIHLMKYNCRYPDVMEISMPEHVLLDGMRQFFAPKQSWYRRIFAKNRGLRDKIYGKEKENIA